ncbi:hypothetical protein LPJ63_001374 [Coemansia sp. RSA 2711]|nr:hypothetical protein LPJ63_001374 [Coemansia sp. RSA 2711]KAJ2313651.1 hypothetical protein IWW54_001386 [Coemansia sp. RSA 2705]KAJ2368532.1 hypothetical protein H4S01_001538 [Coemansia sp. RSA 2610]KAJ2391860.1 hypothetical protein H4S02_001106 [Coemansia sp. RSA 2611]
MVSVSMTLISGDGLHTVSIEVAPRTTHGVFRDVILDESVKEIDRMRERAGKTKLYEGDTLGMIVLVQYELGGCKKVLEDTSAALEPEFWEEATPSVTVTIGHVILDIEF